MYKKFAINIREVITYKVAFKCKDKDKNKTYCQAINKGKTTVSMF